MKKAVTLIILIAILSIGCKNTEAHEKTNTSKVAVQEQESDVLSTQWMNDIQLNNGSKWQANIETTEGVDKMKELLETHVTSSIEDYRQLASRLNEEKNKLVKACTMQGASHDNLHVWLYPLIERITLLTKANNVSEASKIKQGIKESVNAYSMYFQ